MAGHLHFPTAEEHQMHSLDAKLSPPDRLTILWLALLIAVAAASHPTPLAAVALVVSTAVAVVAVAALRTRSRLGRVVHDFLPIAMILAVFNLAGPMVAAANPRRWDGVLAAADDRFFGSLALAWRHALGRPAWLTDFASLAYVSFYFVPLAIAIALYRSRSRREFDAFVFALMTAFYLPYIGYLAFPAYGPRVPASALGGGAVTAVVQAILGAAEINRLDAFPSGHTTVSLTFLVLGTRSFPRWRVPLLASVAGILFSTVYLSFHYVVDLLAGALVAAIVPAAVPSLERVISGDVRAPHAARVMPKGGST
jgi:membrane-associated phospholipid phosphatase